MSIFSLPNLKIAGLSAIVPERNFDLMDYHWVSKYEREQLIKTTGVRYKRIAPEGVTVSDMSLPLMEELLARLSWEKSEVDLLVFISQSRDYLIPATSCILQDRFGFPKTTMAFDVSMGCSAYVYGLSIIGGMMSAGMIRKGLLIMGDTSTFGSYRDKTTYPLFGDAATLTALEYKEGAAPIHFNLQTDGSGYDAIIIEGGGARKFPNKKSLSYKRYEKGVWRHDFQPKLDGIKVFNFSLREVAPNMKKLMREKNVEQSSIDYFVLHQANKLMNETIRKLMREQPEKWPYSIHKYGNTSSASIPITMVSELAEKFRKEKLRLMMSGFGVGLSWGSVIADFENVVCTDVLEYK
jgi:3-oxoacyl-[acyl-carrier-protein] synthase-3